MSRAPWAVLLLVATGCAHSRATRTDAPPQEVVWSYRTAYAPHAAAGLRANMGGTPVAVAPHWAGLGSALACVPAARDYAARAEARSASGSAMATMGAVITLGGLTWAAVNPDAGPIDASLLGATSAVGGLGLWIGGGVLLRQGQARAVDAVNVYNDEWPTTAACARATAMEAQPGP